MLRLNCFLSLYLLSLPNLSVANGVNFSNENWMSLLDDNLKISRIVMPGSHDAGMSELHHCDWGSSLNTGMVKTQQLNIEGQLESGSRFFDIRVDYDHRELVTYHRSGDLGCNGQSLESVMNQSLAFLKNYPSETLILKFSHIRSNRDKQREIKDRIEQFLSTPTYSKYLYTNLDYKVNLSNILLKNTRGKMILTFDYDENTTAKQGRFRYHDGFLENGSNNDDCLFRGPNLTVCDQYTNTTNLSKMEKDQIEKWHRFGGLGQNFMFLLSWTLTPDAGTFFGGSIESLASKANQALPAALEKQIVDENQPPPNIVYIDYMNAQTAKNIIQYNFLD